MTTSVGVLHPVRIMYTTSLVTESNFLEIYKQQMYYSIVFSFLGVFAKLQKVTISLMSECPPAWNNSAPTGWIFIKLYIWVFFKNLLEHLI